MRKLVNGNEAMVEEIFQVEHKIEVANAAIEEQASDSRFTDKIQKLKGKIEVMKEQIRDINIREGMIRAKLDVERQREHNLNPYQDNLQDTMRQLRQSTRRKIVLSSQEADVNDQYFMEQFDDN